MGISERKTKEKEELKALILKGARKLFSEKGIEHTTIRNIADEIEYSVGTVYVYYKDKNAILHDLHTQGFLQLSTEFRVLFTVSDPMERLKALGRSYIRFALENPEMYNLMFTLAAPMAYLKDQQQQRWQEGSAAFGALRLTVEQCMEAGYFKNQHLEATSFAIWSCVHGMCSLYITERIKGVIEESPEAILQKAYGDFILMMDRK